MRLATLDVRPHPHRHDSARHSPASLAVSAISEARSLAKSVASLYAGEQLCATRAGLRVRLITKRHREATQL